MEAWVHFFVGTPRRFAVTACVILFAFAAFFPEVAERALGNVIGAVLGAIVPFEGPLLGLGIAFAGLAILTGWWRPGSKKKGKGH